MSAGDWFNGHFIQSVLAAAVPHELIIEVEMPERFTLTKDESKERDEASSKSCIDALSLMSRDGTVSALPILVIALINELQGIRHALEFHATQQSK